MRFAGRVYFDMGTDTWHLYRFLAACAGAGVDLALSWEPFDGGDHMAGRVLATYAAVRAADPGRHGAFLQALLTAHHGEGLPLGDDLLARAAAAAGVAAAPAEAGAPAAEATTAEARDLGVTAAPALYRHGPVMQVRLNRASLDGDVVARLRLIDAALDDDGVWALVKP